MLDRRTLLAGAATLAASPAIAALPQPAPSRAFPKGFLWGAATAGHQVEGNNVNSDVWFIENISPSSYTEPSDDAANSFQLWPTDLDLVSRRSDYDGLIQSKNGQFLGRDEQLNAASDARLLLDQSELVEGLDHLVN